MTSLLKLFPPLDWGTTYTRSAATNDLLAAVIVTIMLVPQSLAYAMLAGLPPVTGLYASILPLIAYAAFGTSRTLAVGPVAVISLMTAAATAKVSAATGIDPGTAAVMLAALSGVILVAMSVLRLGFLANFLSHPVISGFISASGLLIAAGQLRHLLGVSAPGDTLPAILSALSGKIGETNLPTLVIGLSSLAFLVWVRRHLKPLLRRLGLGARLADLIARAGPVGAIAASIGAVAAFSLGEAGVRLVGEIPAGLPPLALPPLDAGLAGELLMPALLISLVGFVESISVAETLAARRRQRIDPDRELTALGASNIAAAISGGFPVTGGFARSVVNFDAGAETPLAGVFTAVGILAAALFLTPLFTLLPQAVLAATIIVAVLSLVDVSALVSTFRISRADFAAMVVTIITVLGVGVEAGIVAGVVLSLLLVLWHTSRPHVAIVGRVEGTEHFRNVERHKVTTDPTLLSIRIDESLYFANVRYLEKRIRVALAARPEVRHVVLMCPAVNRIDASAIEALEALTHTLAADGVTLHLSEVKGPVMDVLKRSGFLDHFTGKVFLSHMAAVKALTPQPEEPWWP